MNARHLFLALYRLGYERLLRPLIFTRSPEAAHRDAMRLLAMLDGSKAECDSLRLLLQPHAFMNMIITPPDHSPFKCEMMPRLTLAAGFVKGRGFADEESALRAVDAGENIIPGWRAMPALVGAVEFGSFTRYPRLGNSGAVLWRDPATRSTQNRIGLRNPGARAAARFLARHSADLPWYIRYGINIAVSPGVSDEAQEIAEVYESMSLFLDAGVRPKWFTLNLSCPNTEDDPEGNQTAAHARALCSALLAHPGLVPIEKPHPPTPSPYTERGQGVRSEAGLIPLWIKIGPDLGAEQYAALMAVCAEIGVGAIIATNTRAEVVPSDGRQGIRPTTDAKNGVPTESSGVGTPFLASSASGSARVTAGVGGGRLHAHALEAVRHLAAARERLGASVCIVGCGGVLDGDSARALLDAGADALQYWSALIYRGPLAAAVIQRELNTTQYNREGAKNAKI
jgi:dihydroorotate dehydrogenase